MSIKRIWFFCCLLFCGYCLTGPWLDNQYEVTYLAEDANETEDAFQYFGCFSLESLQFERTEIDLDELRNVFYERFQAILSDADGLPAGAFDKWFSNRSASKDSVIVMRHNVCATFNNRSELAEFNRLVSSANITAVMFAFKVDTFDWMMMNSPDDVFDQLIVLQMKQPYSSCDESNRRFHCLMDCFKKGFRLSEYFYSGNETGAIHLNCWQKNHTIRQNENACFKRCGNSNCKLVYIYSDEDSKNTADVKTFRATPVMSELYFNIHLAGLVSLVLNVSFGRLLSIAIRFACSKLKNGRIKRFLFYVKMLLLVVCLLSAAYLVSRMILHYKGRITDPTKKETTRNLVQPETIHLVVCVAVKDILSNYGQKDDVRNEIPYNSMTILQLERATDGALNETIDAIQLDYQDKLSDFNKAVTTKVLFKSDPDGFLQRCFQLTVEPDEPRYQMLLSISKVRIKIKHQRKVRLFLLTENEYLSEASFHLTGSNSLRKRIVKQSQLSGRCTPRGDYEAALTHLKCGTKTNCLERCVQQAFFDTYHNVTTGSDFRLVIDKHHFSAIDWENAYFDTNHNVDEATIASCSAKFSGPVPCDRAYFEESVRINQPDDDVIEFELYYEIVRSIEEEPSLTKLKLDILNIQSIFFGLTLYGSLKVIGEFVGIKLRVRDRSKIFSLIVLVCLVGFCSHIHRAIDDALNANLTYSQHYEIAESVKMPELIFCLDLNQSRIDASRNLTGHYLEGLTKEMSAVNIFRNITFLDSKNSWVELNLNFSNKRFEIETFFFLSKKCFSLKFNISYNTKQFYFLTSGEVLRVTFDPSFFREPKTIHFLTHRTGTMQFSKILKIRKFTPTDAIDPIDYHYSVCQELFLIRHIDKFYMLKNFLKNPLSLFDRIDHDVHDVNGYLMQLLQGFKETYQKVTLNLPIRRDLFDFQIDEQAFESYFSATYEQDQRRPVSSIYDREFATNYYRRDNKLLGTNYDQAEPDFSFSLIHFKKVIIATNDDYNYPKLLINVLNALSIWLSAKFTNVPAYVLALWRSLCLLYGSLRKVKELLSVHQ